MASAPTPARHTASFLDAHAYKPKFNEQDQCYCDYRITLKEFKSYNKIAIKCGICDCDRIFTRHENFNVHLKSDKHKKKLKELNDGLQHDNSATESSESDTNSIITTETDMPALTPIQEVEPKPKTEVPAPAPTQDLYHTALMAEIDRLNGIIRQKDTQLAHLKQTIVHLGEYFRYEEAL